MNQLLSTDQTDALVLDHCQPHHGAIEDCEVHPTRIVYFLEHAEAEVDRTSGSVTFRTL